MKWLKFLAEAGALIAGSVAILWSRPVRDWADNHGLLLYVVAVTLFALCVVLGQLWWSARSRIPKVSARDRELFGRFDREFPRHEGDMAFLREGFTGKHWNWQSLRRLSAFGHVWGRTEYFDDPRIERARKTFHDAVLDFHSDAAGESHVPDETDDVQEARVHRPQDNGASFAQYEAVQQRLRDKARRVVSTYEELYRRGRRRGL